MKYAINFVFAFVLLLGTAHAQSNCPGGVCPIPYGQPQYSQPRLGQVPVQPSANLDPSLSAAIVRIRNASGNGATLGSGTLVDDIDGTGVVLSCAHLFKEGKGQLTVVFPDGQRYAAEAIDIDQSRDLSALAITMPKVRPIHVCETAPIIGDSLWSSGYGGNDVLFTNYGKALRFITIQGSNAGNFGIELSGMARSGDSGGPIFNQRGELAGVLFGTDGRVVGGTHSVECCKFLANVRNRFVGPRGNQPSPGPIPYNAQPSDPPTPRVELPPAPDSGLLADLDRLRRQAEQATKERDDALNDANGKKSVIDGLREKLNEVTGKLGNGPNVIEKVVEKEAATGLTGLIVTATGMAAGPASWLALALAGGGGYLARNLFKKKTGESQPQTNYAPMQQIPQDRASSGGMVPTVPQAAPPATEYVNHYVPYETSLFAKAVSHAHAAIASESPHLADALKRAETVTKTIYGSMIERHNQG